MGSFMFLHPILKELRIYDLDISKNISNEGFIHTNSENFEFIDTLIKENIIEIYIGIKGVKINRKKTVIYPLNVTFQITNNCNLNCIHCHRKNKNSNSISLTQFTKVAKQLRKLNVFNINISGGEPLIKPELFDMIKVVVALGMKATISSNTVLMNKTIINKLYNAGLRNMQVSFDSYKSLMHDRIRGVNGAYAAMVKNLPLLVNKKIKFTLVTSLINQTPKEYAKTIDTAYRLGASAHKTNTVIPQGEGRKMQDMVVKDFSPYIKIWKDKKEQYKNKMTVMAESMFAIQIGIEQISPLNNPPMMRVGCPGAILTCNIDEIGNVTPCSFFPDYVFGNILKDNFIKIWNSPLANKIRERKLIRVCNNCKYTNNCGGCRARSFGNYNIISETDKYCFINNKLSQ